MSFNKPPILRAALTVLVACLVHSPSARADRITVSAAASLKDVLSALGRDYSRRGGGNIGFNFASSGTLQRQIEAGAPIDLFVAAALPNMEQLARKNEIDPATRRIFARGELVLIAPRGSKLRSFQGLRAPAVRTIAIGGPGVPAGDYARQTLRFLGLSGALNSKLIFSRDVRSVLNQVAAGNADAGVVYKTDALSTKNVTLVAKAPPRSHSPVVYPMAIPRSAPNRAGALRFWRYLQSPDARRTLRRFGFQ